MPHERTRKANEARLIGAKPRKKTAVSVDAELMRSVKAKTGNFSQAVNEGLRLWLESREAH